MKRTKAFAAVLAAALAVSSAGAASAQPAAPAPEPATIAAIRFEGLTTVDSARVGRSLRIGPGDALSPSILRDALRRAWRLEVFQDLWLTGLQTQEGLVLTLHAVERPRIARLEIDGNDEIDTDDLVESSGLVAGRRLAQRDLSTAVDTLTRLYRKKGYVQASVRADTRPIGESETVVLFRVDEGKQARVTAFDFPGAENFETDELGDKLSSKKKGFLRSGKVDPEKLREDVTKLTGFYRNHGFRDVEVEPARMRFSEDGEELTLVYAIDEGPRYRIGSVEWRGNEALGNDHMRLLPQPQPGDVYDQSAVSKAVEEAYAHYAELGYLYVSVEPRELVTDPGVVNLVFQCQEGDPSRLNRIFITGNTYTKEKVVRRELSIREGDRFRRSALMRTQQDVFRLGYFEDVQVDFRPADSTDVDLYLRVVEKRTGTASAGAGFSSEGGLTGFLQLGHNNLFGNGQSVDIQIERGARRSNVNLGFTDPWFLDSRTTLGFTLFSRNRETRVVGSDETLEFDDERRGGSIRFGRPLGWDFTRGFLTYRIENVEQKVDEGEDLSEAQKELRDLIRQGRRTTSSVTLSWLRDSRNNPFYPDGGSRVSLSTEFAGKVLGGNVNFNKHELDGRWYFPSIIPGVATLVRYRAGILAGYGDGSAVPEYERFRLGGTTFYSLRGYEDFELVPEENIITIRDTLDSEAPFDTVNVSTVRYPGGRWMQIFTVEQQFPIANPLRGVLFFDAGDTWNAARQIQPLDLHKSVGFGFRLEVPLLGNLGLDFGYGFDRPDPGWRTHFLLGNLLF